MTENQKFQKDGAGRFFTHTDPGNNWVEIKSTSEEFYPLRILFALNHDDDGVDIWQEVARIHEGDWAPVFRASVFNEDAGERIFLGNFFTLDPAKESCEQILRWAGIL